MAEDFGYCESCGRRITGDDLEFGSAVRRDGRLFCIACAKRSAAETGAMPAARPDGEPASRPASAHNMRAARRRRRGNGGHRPSSRRLRAGRSRPDSESGTRLDAGVREAEVEALAVSVLCPYCGEKLVAKVSGLPTTHKCEICGKLMRVRMPRPGPGR